MPAHTDQEGGTIRCSHCGCISVQEHIGAVLYEYPDGMVIAKRYADYACSTCGKQVLALRDAEPRVFKLPSHN